MLFAFEITPQQLKQRLDAGEEMLILDVRDLGEYSIAHIDGARLVPLDALPGRLTSLADWRNRPVVIYCHRGERSMRAMEILKDHGFTELKILDGGINSWCQEVEPHKPRYGETEGGHGAC